MEPCSITPFQSVAGQANDQDGKETKAATGNENKLAAASPTVASKASQQKIMARPRPEIQAETALVIEQFKSVLDGEKRGPCCSG